jgi:adenylate cyclase
LNQRRTIAGDPVTSAYLALRIGEVFFGSIGSEQGLDFTVVAPGGERGQSDRCDVPVGRTERAGLFRIRRGAATAEKAKLVSVVRSALRGAGRAQELFTLDPAVVWLGRFPEV